MNCSCYSVLQPLQCPKTCSRTARLFIDQGSSVRDSTKEPCIGDQDNLVSFPNDWFRLGIIPSSSTDAIVLRKVSLGIAQVVRWKTSPTAEVLPTVRFAASFAGYGFYGEVIRECERYRWMGPARYDFSGTMVFLKHRSYEANVAFLETPYTHSLTSSAEDDVTGAQPLQSRWKKPRKIICRTNCFVCKEASTSGHNPEDVPDNSRTICENQKWVWSEGHFLSVGAAVISCRNERAPDGLVADAHLSNGFLHLLLIRDCPLPLYLWHLTQFTKKGSDPLSFKFVEPQLAVGGWRFLLEMGAPRALQACSCTSSLSQSHSTRSRHKNVSVAVAAQRDNEVVDDRWVTESRSHDMLTAALFNCIAQCEGQG